MYKKWKHLQWPKIGQETLQLFHENIEDNSNIYSIYKKTIANIVTAYMYMYLFIKKFWFHINLTQVINFTMKIIQFIENIYTIHNWYGKKHLIAIGFDFLKSLWLHKLVEICVQRRFLMSMRRRPQVEQRLFKLGWFHVDYEKTYFCTITFSINTLRDYF